MTSTTPATTPPPSTREIQDEIWAFGEAYGYDASYLADLLDASPGAFAAFQAAQGLSVYREALSLEAHFVARIAATRAQDCGPCAQLNLRMALEAGVARELLQTLIDAPNELPAELRDVYAHATAASAGGASDPERDARLREALGAEGFAELAVVLTGASLYPILKRGLSRSEHCEILTLDF